MSLNQGTISNVTIPGPGPFGFRLAGGKDFGLPLHISKLTAGGKAQQAQLREKDVILMINGQDIATCTHLDAQNKIKAAFHDDLHLRTQRGDTRVWNPVTKDESSGAYKVSLKANNNQEFMHPGTKSNFAPKGYGSPQPSGPSPVRSVAPPAPGRGSAQVVHLQFNSPAGLYSEQNIAETFKGQTEGMIDNSVGEDHFEPQPYQPMRDTGYGPKPGEVSATEVELDPGQEPKYSGYINPGAQSRSFKMLKAMVDSEADSGDSPPAAVPSESPDRPVATATWSQNGGAVAHQASPATTRPVGVRSVRAPAASQPQPTSPGGQQVRDLPNCAVCQSNIIGRFVRVMGLPMHEGCFNCRDCGISLRNKGYYNIDGRVYCKDHATARTQRQRRPGGAPQHTPTYSQPAARSPQAYSSPQAYNSPQSYGSNYAPPPPPPQPVQPASRVQMQIRPRFQPKPKVNPNALIVKALQDNPDCLQTHKGIQPVFTVGDPVKHKLTNEVEADRRRFQPPPNRPRIITEAIVNFLEDNQDTDDNPDAGPQPPAPNRPRAPQAAPVNRPRPAVSQPPKGGDQYCDGCRQIIKGTVVTALGKSWHPDHFVCAHCHDNLKNQGFVEHDSKVYCQTDYNKLYAPRCFQCGQSIAGNCVTAMGRSYHPEHFVCVECKTQIGDQQFMVNNGQPYCRKDHEALFSHRCASCNFTIDAGDPWVEAMDKCYHSNCFNCSICQTPLEGQKFYAKNSRPVCQTHAY